MATPSKKTSTPAAAPARKSAARQAPARSAAARKPAAPVEATALLRVDHKHVSDLFTQYAATRSQARKRSLVESICTELAVHAQVEEEIFYPAVKAALKDKEMVPEALVEHAMLKELIAQLEGKEPDGEMFDAKIKVLSEYVQHHVKEEQNAMFPKARASKLDMRALGAQIATRKQELMASRGAAGKPGLLAKVIDALV